MWENTTPTELPSDFCAGIGPLQLGVVLVFIRFKKYLQNQATSYFMLARNGLKLRFLVAEKKYVPSFRRWQAPPAILYIAEMKRNSGWTIPAEAGGRPGKEYMKPKTTTTTNVYELTYNLYSVNL